MENKDVIKEMKFLQEVYIDLLENDNNSVFANRYKTLIEAYKLAENALEKQIPKKPTHQATLPRDFTCPKCLNAQRDKAPYCQFCGQKLDWEE